MYIKYLNYGFKKYNLISKIILINLHDFKNVEDTNLTKIHNSLALLTHSTLWVHFSYLLTHPSICSSINISVYLYECMCVSINICVIGIHTLSCSLLFHTRICCEYFFILLSMIS